MAADSPAAPPPTTSTSACRRRYSVRHSRRAGLAQPAEPCRGAQHLLVQRPEAARTDEGLVVEAGRREGAADDVRRPHHVELERRRRIMVDDCIPSRTGSVQARTPGASPTWTRQLGHWPAQHIRPRRRWYLKLRENVRRPAANSAEPIVSPLGAVLLAVEAEAKLAPGRCARRAAREPAHANSSSAVRTGAAAVGARWQQRRHPRRRPAASVHMTSLVRVSRSAMNHAPQPERWFHHSRWSPATLARK